MTSDFASILAGQSSLLQLDLSLHFPGGQGRQKPEPSLLLHPSWPGSLVACSPLVTFSLTVLGGDQEWRPLVDSGTGPSRQPRARLLQQLVSRSAATTGPQTHARLYPWWWREPADYTTSTPGRRLGSGASNLRSQIHSELVVWPQASHLTCLFPYMSNGDNNT